MTGNATSGYDRQARADKGYIEVEATQDQQHSYYYCKYRHQLAQMQTYGLFEPGADVAEARHSRQCAYSKCDHKECAHACVAGTDGGCYGEVYHAAG